MQVSRLNTLISPSESVPCSSNQPATSSDTGQADKPQLRAVMTLVSFPNPFLPLLPLQRSPQHLVGGVGCGEPAPWALQLGFVEVLCPAEPLVGWRGC